MSPTRELAKQINEEFQTIGKAIGLRIQAIYGGVSLQDNYTLLQKGMYFFEHFLFICSYAFHGYID